MGQAIIEHQAVGFRLVDAKTRLEAARQLVLHAARLKSDDKPALEAACMAKLFASETAEAVCSAAIQTLGGYGYLADYPIERYFRDLRVHKILEGSNEINRQLVVTMLLKRIARGRLEPGVLPAANDVVSQAKNLAWAALHLAQETFSVGLEQQQEVVMAIADIIIQIFAMESVVGRAQKRGLVQRKDWEAAQEMSAVLIRDAAAQINLAAGEIFNACGQIQAPQIVLGPVDVIGLRRKIARRVLDAGRYVV